MDELEELRQKRLLELQKRQQEIISQKNEEQEQLQGQIEQLETAVKQFLTKDALQRYGNLKAAHQEKAVQLLVILGQALQQGQITKKITDAQLKNILMQMQKEKKEFKIKRI
jgi:programmed cell death protein 5